VIETIANIIADFLTSLFEHEWTLIESPGGAKQWEAVNGTLEYPDPFIPNKFRKATMLTSDLALREDPIYNNISKTFLDDFDLLSDKFARAWCMWDLLVPVLFCRTNIS
jgi:catalase-peroxidase